MLAELTPALAVVRGTGHAATFALALEGFGFLLLGCALGATGHGSHGRTSQHRGQQQGHNLSHKTNLAGIINQI
jgi:hypothetical protein